MKRSSAAVAALLFGSGFCALIYQTVWFRQFRLIFGVSTLATAAVLAIFMGGLGVGSALLGKRADAHPRPLRLYGNLELGMAISAALSPAEQKMIATVDAEQERTVGLLEQWVNQNSGSLNIAGVPSV